MQTHLTDQIHGEAASSPKHIDAPDPDIQMLILEWVVPCLIDDFLDRPEWKAKQESHRVPQCAVSSLK